MSGPLLLFPTRIAIGNAGGVPVYMSLEFSRVLGDLVERVGGAFGTDNTDLESLAAFTPSASVDGPGFGEVAAATGAALADLRAQLDRALAQLDGARAAIGPLVQRIESLEMQMPAALPSLDWGRPGPIGAQTPNSGVFTALTASALDQQVSFRPTGTGTVTIRPAATPGAMDNVVIGAAVPLAATFTTLTAKTVAFNSASGFIEIMPTGGGAWVSIWPATLGRIDSMTIGANVPAAATFTTLTASGQVNLNPANNVVNLKPTGALSGVFIAPVTVGNMDNMIIGNTTPVAAKVTTLTAVNGFGCNGKTAQPAFALGAAAIDLPTVIVLANNLRNLSIGNGTGA